MLVNGEEPAENLDLYLSVDGEKVGKKFATAEGE
jgi:hypothetical protein